MSVTRHFHWGIGIGLSYVLFAGATVAFVVFALGQQVELVSPDYYGQSLTYDRRIEATRHAAELGPAVQCALAGEGRTLVVTLPRDQASAAGTLTMYRPSGGGTDRVLPLAVDASGAQRVSLAGLARGRWVLKMEWQARGRAYYREEAMDLP
jgi:nitrogen fixation protein FixH